MVEHELKSIVRGREKRTLEYKEAWSELPSNLFESVCAFLNRDGGVIVLGAMDDGTIDKGVNPKSIDQMCKNLANMSNNGQVLKPSFLLQPEIVSIPSNTTDELVQVIVLQVPSSSQVHRFKGKVFDRSVDGDFELRTDAEISALYLRKSTQYTENTIYPYLKPEHFKDGIVAKAKNLIRNMRENHPWLELSNMDFFKQANLYRIDLSTGEEGFTLAALMLFGRDEIIQSALPYYKVDCVVRRVNTDRYDDRFTSYGNLIDAYTELMSFFEKHFPDTFFMEGTQRVSLRDKVFREVVTNMLIHREYLNPSISLIDIREDYVLIQNANRPLRSGVITLDNYEPHPKNPHLANFFVQMGRAEHLGTGVRNLYHYAPLYFGETPLINDDDMFRVCFKISEAKQTEITTNKTTNKTTSKTTSKPTSNTTSKTTSKLATKSTQRVLAEILQKPEITMGELMEKCGLSLYGVRYHLRKLRNQKTIVRIGGTNGGYWKVYNVK